MLDNAPSPSRAPTEWPAVLERDRQLLNLTDLADALKRSVWLLAGSVLLALALALAYVVSKPPIYIATAQLMIEPAKRQLLWSDSNMVDLTVDNAQVESQLEILRSEQTANDVIGQLKLADDPEFRYARARSDYERHRVALSRFQDALSTRRIGQSYVIEIAFRSVDPEKAARIANAIVQAYIRDQLNSKAELARQATQWMQERVTELGLQLNEAAAAVQTFRAANGIVDTGANPPRLLNKLTELEARAQAYRKLYESFVQKMTENRQQESYPVSNARIIAAASIPLAKSYPKTTLVLMLALLLGFLVGGAVAAARAVLDRSIRTVRQIREVLGLDCLASLPRFAEPTGAASGRASPEVLGEPYAPFTEAMRGLKLSVQSACDNKPGMRIGVLSFASGEGKSTVALNLTALFAASGSNTLLIDADFRDPALSRRLVPTAESGLFEALAHDADPAPIFDPTTTAHILPAVDGGHMPESSDLLGSAAMRRLSQQLEQVFDATIVDLPASASAVEARAVGPLLDGCILVVEWGRTPAEPLADAIERLRSSRVPLLGAVLNKVDDGVPKLFGFPIAWLHLFGGAGYRVRPATARPS